MKKIGVVKRERKTDFGEVWRALWNPEPQQKSVEDTILTDSDLSKEQKEELIKAMESADKLAGKMFSNKGTKTPTAEQPIQINMPSKEEINKATDKQLDIER